MSRKHDNITYDDYIRGIDKLEPEQQLRLVELISAKLYQQIKNKKNGHKITELHGLGAEIWKPIDVDEYLEQERSSWD
jgi:hypothetical protein